MEILFWEPPELEFTKLKTPSAFWIPTYIIPLLVVPLVALVYLRLEYPNDLQVYLPDPIDTIIGVLILLLTIQPLYFYFLRPRVILTVDEEDNTISVRNEGNRPARANATIRFSHGYREPAKFGFQVFTGLRIDPETVPESSWGRYPEVHFWFDVSEKKVWVDWKNESMENGVLRQKENHEPLDLREYYLRIDVEWEYAGQPNNTFKCFRIAIIDGEPQFMETFC
jgi:hypothetical protein